MLPPLYQVITAATLGVLAHWCFFVHGEHDLAAANIARVHLAAAVIRTSFDSQGSWIEASKHTFALAAVYATALYSSMLFYRIFLSSLNHIDGPLNCEFLHELHKRYGYIVRTGPNEVTAFDIDAFNTVHRQSSSCGRAAYYDILHPMVSLVTTRDPQVHA
ncbi:cytochrome P450 [Aspergillus affinis]|uniref:cytochrome P450 n=1 Tax=Aspergillus affinis TaxID=1070780 RepID=UPI0022FDCA68|nr:cytochrome P450 [Aspergillus affinis]KAI9038663.1 cytochrome P450 [Aspergillus affinis]